MVFVTFKTLLLNPWQEEPLTHLLDFELHSKLIKVLPPHVFEDSSFKSLPYDITFRPESYLFSYILLSRLYDEYQISAFQAVPLSTSLIPRHIPIDTKILLSHVLGIKKQVPINSDTKPNYWCQVFNLNIKTFKSRRGVEFQEYGLD